MISWKSVVLKPQFDGKVYNESLIRWKKWMNSISSLEKVLNCLNIISSILANFTYNTSLKGKSSMFCILYDMLNDKKYNGYQVAQKTGAEYAR